MVAPAGFGKTSLLDKWQEDNTYNHVARVNLSFQDNKIVPVMFAVLKKIRRIMDVYDASIFNLFTDGIDINDRLLTDSIFKVFSMIDEPLFIVVDDFKSDDIKKYEHFLIYLIENLPKHVHFIFASRYYPSINLSRLKLSDKLLFIDSHDFMADKPQIEQLAKEVCGKPLSQPQVDKILDLTEGWLAGVKIALLAIKEYGEKGLDEFNGSQRDVMEYFGSEVFSTLEDGHKRFYLATSLLGRFNAQLCDYLLRTDQSEDILQNLMHQSVFIVEDKSNPGWYRYHSLMEDFLRKRIGLYFSDEELGLLYKRAIQGCIDQSNYVLAIQYGGYLDNDEERIQLLINCCDYWLKQGEFSHIIKALDDIEESVLLSDSRLYIALAYALIFSRRFNQSAYFLEVLEENVKHKNAVTKGDIDFLELSLNLFQRDMDALSKHSVNQSMIMSEESDTRRFALIIAAYYELQNGALKRAMVTAHKAKSILSEKGFVFLESYADLLIALCDRYMGRGIDAATYIDQIYQKNKYQNGSLAWVSLSVAMVVVYYERNELSKAKELCEKLLPSLNHSCVTEVISTVYLYLSRLLFISGDKVKSARVLNQLDRILILGRYERIASQSLYEEMRQAYISNDEAKAKRVIVDFELVESDANKVDDGGKYVESFERRTLALAYGLCLKGQYDGAISLLYKVVDQLRGLAIVSREIVILSNIAVMESLKGQRHTGVSILKSILDEYGILSFSRTMFDEAPGLDKVFLSLEETTAYDIPSMYRTVFSDVLKKSEYSEHVSHLPVLSLTDKEMQVYKLLENGLSNADISQELGVALSTTKWHLKNIFQKLGVSKRSEIIMYNKVSQD